MLFCKIMLFCSGILLVSGLSENNTNVFMLSTSQTVSKRFYRNLRTLMVKGNFYRNMELIT